MSCTTLKNLLDQAASPADIDRLVADFGYRSHLDACPSCRAEFAAARQLLDFFARQKASAATVPEEEVRATRVAILRAVAERERRAAQAFLPTWLFDPLLAGGLAAAALVVIALGIVELRHSSTAIPKRVAAVRAVPVATPHLTTQQVRVATKTGAPPPAASKPKSPLAPPAQLVTIAALQTEFNRLKASQNGVTQDFLRQLLAFIDQDMTSPDDRIAARQLLVETYEQFGEFDRALTAFGDYIDLVESRNGRDRAAATAEAKANALFEGQRDYLRGMAYYDLVAARYPGTPQAEHARFMGGRYFQRQDMWTEAATEYRRIADELPAESPWKKRATMELPLVLGNAGKPEEGIAVMARFAEEAKDPNDAAYAHFEIGRLYYYMGEAHYPDAIKHFRTILDNYAGHGYERDTRRMLVRMQHKITDDMPAGITN